MIGRTKQSPDLQTPQLETMLFDVVQRDIATTRRSCSDCGVQISALIARMNTVELKVTHGELPTNDQERAEALQDAEKRSNGARDVFWGLQQENDAVVARGIEALKEWTGKSEAKLVFDSTVDWITGNSLFEKIKNKPNVAFVCFTADGDVCGGFYSVAVTKLKEGFDDPNLFIFSFESHGR